MKVLPLFLEIWYDDKRFVYGGNTYNERYEKFEIS